MAEIYDFSKAREYKLYSALKPLARVVCKTLYRCTYIGKENIPADLFWLATIKARLTPLL